MNNNTIKQPQINLEDAEDVICPYCEQHKTPDEPSQNIFIQAHIIKKISAFNSPSGQEMYIPVPIFICQVCGLQFSREENSDI